MHEYPPSRSYDSVSVSRVAALRDCGLTLRQRQFLVTVMVHAGCFLERQYCAFTGTARGQNSREFVARLVARGFARAIEPGPIRRGRLYHVHHKPLYEAIGLPNDRHRRLVSLGRIVEKVMILDAVLGDPSCWWLSPEADKRTFLADTREITLRPEDYPHVTFGSGSRRTVRLFPDKLPIGIVKADTSRYVFLYLVTRPVPVDFRQFLYRHRDLLATLHLWTIRLLVPRRFATSVALYKAALREELWTPMDPSVAKQLERYFRERREQGEHVGEPVDPYLAKAFRQHGMARVSALYRAWRRDGDMALWRSSGTSLRDDRTYGFSAYEIQMLNGQYLQLTRTIDRETGAPRGAKRKRLQVGPPPSALLHDQSPSSLVSP